MDPAAELTPGYRVHLKAVFAKVGVQSRAELVATLYVRHYEPHRGTTPSPYGYYLGDNVAAV